MVCFKCLTKMIPIDLNKKSQDYHVDVCPDCGKIIAKPRDWKVIAGHRAC